MRARWLLAITGLIYGVVIGHAFVASISARVVTATWHCAACPPDTYDSTALAVCDGQPGVVSDRPQAATAPGGSVTHTWASLTGTNCKALVTAIGRTTGKHWSGEPMALTGVPSPPVPTSTPTPTSTPPAQQSADCTKAVTITDATGAVWSLKGTDVIRSGQVLPGLGIQFKYVGGSVYLLGIDKVTWFQWSGTAWVSVGAEPACGVVPTPTVTPPVPTPTSTPTPDPTLARIESKIDALAASHVPQVVVPVTCPVSVASIQANYANGDLKLTIRMPQGCKLPTIGAGWQVIR